ncbi:MULTISPECIES: response regulator [Dehalococcoides]|jgi:excisionase family DNA binding protein|uniref:DNA-binding response regulator, two-component system, NtrC family n=4 Tax=Dehalococcoides mccartyi TaxID=61435 RepID=A0A142VAX7_9CHLR|nr:MULTISPECIES: response regulator [Dehalococcoides]AGG06754.1 DNA-binding response regulator [Dehalococcoides mccartyi DCMB5]AGG08249.1 DNA-binding response regulator [Dehalococcoides mccartyi BTF08]AII61252.1 chemotaxis protein CheY [Dehalococcoides mccartyi CG5]AMU86948.1 DNA-binding response regulator, two-component system, NtrC family [Dehalococcoides mccartyi]AOV99736.1 nitrogen regulation protein [Dehalococcoides mccartyi]
MADLMTVREVAEYLRVTQKTIYRLLQRNAIPALKVSHSWRFDKSSIDEWLRKSAVGVRASVLVIDDEITVRSLFKETLEEQGHVVSMAKNGEEALEQLQSKDFDLVFLDLKMPGLNGAELYQKIRAIKPKLPVTIITGYPDSDTMAKVLAQGPFGVMNKPFGEMDIINATKNFLRISPEA